MWFIVSLLCYSLALESIERRSALLFYLTHFGFIHVSHWCRFYWLFPSNVFLFFSFFLFKFIHFVLIGIASITQTMTVQTKGRCETKKRREKKNYIYVKSTNKWTNKIRLLRWRSAPTERTHIKRYATISTEDQYLDEYIESKAISIYENVIISCTNKTETK